MVDQGLSHGGGGDRPQRYRASGIAVPTVHCKDELKAFDRCRQWAQEVDSDEFKGLWAGNSLMGAACDRSLVRTLAHAERSSVQRRISAIIVGQ